MVRIWGRQRRWIVGLCAAIGMILFSACGPQQELPPNASWVRVPEKFERIEGQPEIVEIDLCESSTAEEREIARSISVGTTVQFDREELQRVGLGLAAGAGMSAGEIPIGLQLGVEARLEKEASQKYGTGLTAGESKTQRAKVYVNPHTVATVELRWVELWEEGHIEVYRDGQPLGQVSYRLLKDLQLNSRTKTYECSWWGQLKRKTNGWGRLVSKEVSEIRDGAKSLCRKAEEAWPFGHLGTWMIGSMMVGVAGLVLGIRWYRRRRKASRDWFDRL